MSTSKSDQPAVILPIIRNVLPNIIADELCSVQPMANMMNPFSKKWEKVGMDMPTDKWVYNIRVQEIRDWIEEQPIHMWKLYEIPNELINDVPIQAYLGQNYIFTDEMEAWFQLRWS